MAATHGRKGRPWERARAKALARDYRDGATCKKCGKGVDPPGTWPPRHPLSPSADHKTPLSKAPWLANDPDNLRLMHYGCNSARGDGSHEHVTRTW